MAQTARSQPGNSFTVDKPTVHIEDINNPPKVPYNPHDPKNEFPKLLYHHDTGRVLRIEAGPEAEKQQKAALKRGFVLQPSPKYDYSKINRGGLAAPSVKGPKREEEMSAEELAALDEPEQAG